MSTSYERIERFAREPRMTLKVSDFIWLFALGMTLINLFKVQMGVDMAWIRMLAPLWMQWIAYNIVDLIKMLISALKGSEPLVWMVSYPFYLIGMVGYRLGSATRRDFSFEESDPEVVRF